MKNHCLLGDQDWIGVTFFCKPSGSEGSPYSRVYCALPKENPLSALKGHSSVFKIADFGKRTPIASTGGSEGITDISNIPFIADYAVVTGGKDTFSKVYYGDIQRQVTINKTAAEWAVATRSGAVFPLGGDAIVISPAPDGYSEAQIVFQNGQPACKGGSASLHM